MIRRRAKIRKTHSWREAKRTLKRLGGQIGVSSGMKRPPIAQRRFNLDEPRRYFQNRRDSVLLAQQRIFKAGGVSPERVMHRDSVSIARKRMREKNAAQLAACDTPREAQVVFERLRPIADTSPPNGRKTTNTLTSQSAEGPSAYPNHGMRALLSNGYGWG